MYTFQVNKGQTGGLEDIDINVAPAWERGFDGRGVVITILDDGIDHSHPDIRANYVCFLLFLLSVICIS